MNRSKNKRDLARLIPTRHLLCVFAIMGCISCSPAIVFANNVSPDDDDKDKNSSQHKSDALENNKKVKSLFESMRNGTYKSRGFPKLTRDDIPALMSLADSTRILKAFPRYSISSQYEETCPEGIVAIWLVEGVRKGSKFPSLNALCLPGGKNNGDWTELSKANHPQLAAAYKKWWENVKQTDTPAAFKANPLKGTNLHWH